jgi:hypothetical protein
MKWLFVLAAVLSVPSLAKATWILYPSNIAMTAGTGTVAYVSISGVTLWPTHIRFASDNEGVIHVSGEFTYPKVTANDPIQIQAVGAGVAHIVDSTGFVFATVTVAPAPTPPVRPTATGSPDSRVSLAIGQSISLRVLALSWSPSTYTWYSGRIGDTKNPLAGTSRTHTFLARAVGESDIWVELAGAAGSTAVQFEIDVVAPPRSRVARH